MTFEESEQSNTDELHREGDPDDTGYGGVAPWVASLKSELFDDLTTEDVCYITSLDKSTVLKYLREGTIEGYQLGRSWRIPPESLRKFKEHLLAEARRATMQTQLERECARLQAAEPDAGWSLERCPKTNDPILVKDETELDVDAFQGLGEREYLKTGRKVGRCEACSYWYEDVYVPADHTFGPWILPEQHV